MRNIVRALCVIAGSAVMLVPSASSAAEGAVTAAASPVTAAASPVTAAASPAAASVTIAAVGDTMLGNTPDLPPQPGSYFDAAESALDGGAQIVFGNLEGTLTTSTASKCGPGPHPDCFAFRDPPGYAGASLVIASGPHVLRGMQFYQGRLIAYSLGNFAGYGNFATAGDLGMSVILHVTLSASGRFEGARIYPIRFTGTGRPVPGGGAVAFVARLSMEDFGPSGARILASGVIKAPAAYRP